MRRNTRVLVCSLALLACQRDDSGGDEGDPPSDGDEGDELDGDGDGDGDPDEGDAEPVCDLSQFPKLVPEWIVEVESPLEGATPSVSALEVTSDAIFVAGRHDISSSEPPGFVERRDFDGKLAWVIELPKVRNMVIAWDGQHLYGAYGQEVRRWTAEGLEDDWSISAEFIADMAVGLDSVAVVGSYSDQGGHDDHVDAFFGTYTKTTPPRGSDGGRFGVFERSEFGEVVAPSPWGGWIAAGSYNDFSAYGHSWIVGFGGPELTLTLKFLGYSRVVGLAAHHEVLTVIGRNSVRGVVWLSSISSGGGELARHEHQLCTGVGSSIQKIVHHEGVIWAIGTVWTGQEQTSPLLVRFTFEGQIQSTHAFAVEADSFRIEALDVEEGTAYIGGYLRAGDEFRRIVGRVQL
ncbi:MAG: hypothetical protein R6X02_21070 [Enhygromyxa sp.]